MIRKAALNPADTKQTIFSYYIVNVQKRSTLFTEYTLFSFDLKDTYLKSKLTSVLSILPMEAITDHKVFLSTYRISTCLLSGKLLNCSFRNIHREKVLSVFLKGMLSS